MLCSVVSFKKSDTLSEEKVPSSVIELTKGVKEIVKIDTEGDDVYSFTVRLEGDSDSIKNAIMSQLISEGIQISEIYSEKPDLEAVFVKMINNSSGKTGIQELLEEITAETGGDDPGKDPDKKEAEE